MLPTTEKETSDINKLTDLISAFDQKKGGSNLFVDYIVNGLGDDYPATIAEHIELDLYGDDYLEIRNDQWNRIQEYYSKISQ